MAKKISKQMSDRAKQLGLAPNEALFVHHYIETGDKRKAATLAGHPADYGYQLFNKPRVHAAILKEIEWRDVEDAATGRRVLRELAEHGDSESVRFQAAKELLNRAMGPPASRQITTHKVTLGGDMAELMGRIAELQNELGIANGKVVDADFEEVEEAEDRLAKLPFKAS